jgi:hypothetical protein
VSGSVRIMGVHSVRTPVLWEDGWDRGKIHILDKVYLDNSFPYSPLVLEAFGGGEELEICNIIVSHQISIGS